MNDDKEYFKRYETFQKYMESEFPELYKDKKFGGFCVGEGWRSLIIELSSVISSYIKWETTQNNKDIKPIEIQQIKEKFGGLRFYYQGGDDYVRGAVRLAEEISYTRCETCGNAGKVRKGSWIKTLCDEHEVERQKNYADMDS